MEQNLANLIYRRIEQLKPKKIKAQPKKLIIQQISKNVKKLKGTDMQKYIAVAKMIQSATPIEATRIFFQCIESDNFDNTFFSAVKNLNLYKDKKLKQNKLFYVSRKNKNKKILQ